MTDAGDQTRDRLLAEGRAVWLEEGVARFSLREVARRARVSPAAVYRHFQDKDALLAAIGAAGFRTFALYLMDALSAKTAYDRLAAAADAYLRFATEKPQDYRVIFMGALERSAPKLDSSHETFQFLVDRVAECQREGVIRRGDAREIALGIWAHVHGLVSLRMTGHLDSVGTDAEFRRFYQKSTEQLVDGLTPTRRNHAR